MKGYIPAGMKPGSKTKLSPNKIYWIIVTGMVALLLLSSIACSEPIPTDPVEILDQAANVTQVKYDWYVDVIDLSGNSREGPVVHVMVKGTKMRIGGTDIDLGGEQEYLIDFDENTMYVWYPPENKPTEMKNAWEIPEMTSAMIWADSLKWEDPQIIGTETIDGKKCVVIEFNQLWDNTSDTTSGKAWVWIKNPFLVQIENSYNNGKLLYKFKNIDFGDIPDSEFELPGPLSPIGSVDTMPPATTPAPPPLDILSPDDSLELVSINPVSGTILEKGTSVQFSVTVSYELKSVEEAVIHAVLRIESGPGIGIGPGIEVQQGSGTAVIEDSVDVNFLIETLKSDKVNLELSLVYQTSPHEGRGLVQRFFKDCFFIIDSSPPDEQNGAGASPSASAISPPTTGAPQSPELNFDVVIDGLEVTVNGGTRPVPPGTTITRIHFDWGDGYSEDDWFPAYHIYSHGGTYTVMVTSYQSDGLSTTKFITVEVSDQA